MEYWRNDDGYNWSNSKGAAPVVNLHYAALQSDKPIDEMHVHQILGVGNHSKEHVETVIQNLKEWKQYVCGWGGTQIKMKMVEVARRIKESDFTAAIKFNGKELSNFLDIKKWRRNPMVQKEEKNRNSMYYMVYGYWEENQDWDQFLEKKNLEESGWSYCAKSKKAVQGKSQQWGYEVKGCIAQNFSHVKHELVKQIQKAGRDLLDNSNFAKSRRGQMKGATAQKRRK